MQNGASADRWLAGVRNWIRAGFPIALVLSVQPAFSSDQPDSQPSPVSIDESLIPALPETAPVWQGPELPLELRQAAPFGPEDKGGSFTDMGRDALGSPRNAEGLTEREKALLELSRAAVEASRQTGTLQQSKAEPLAGPHANLADAVRRKQEALARPAIREAVPGSGGPSDLAGVASHGAGDGRGGADVSGRTSASGAPLSDAELAKLAAAKEGSGLVVLPVPSAPIVEQEGAPRPGQEGATNPSSENAGAQPGRSGSQPAPSEAETVTPQAKDGRENVGDDPEPAKSGSDAPAKKEN